MIMRKFFLLARASIVVLVFSLKFDNVNAVQNRKGEEIMVENLQFEDSQEGLNSFKEKRKPQWTHQSN